VPGPCVVDHPAAAPPYRLEDPAGLALGSRKVGDLVLLVAAAAAPVRRPGGLLRVTHTHMHTREHVYTFTHTHTHTHMYVYT